MYKLKMKKILTFLMISLASISMCYASGKIILEDYINSFAWEKRIVLFISKSKYVYFINETDNFFKKNKCENDNRNLKYIRIVGDEVKKYNISEKFNNKYGMWLIGYDGQIKSYSSDISLLKEVYNIGRGERVQLMDFVTHIEKNLGRIADKKLVEKHPADTEETWSDTNKLQQLGYNPKVSIHEGVEKFINWYKSYYKVN